MACPREREKRQEIWDEIEANLNLAPEHLAAEAEARVSRRSGKTASPLLENGQSPRAPTFGDQGAAMAAMAHPGWGMATPQDAPN